MVMMMVIGSSSMMRMVVVWLWLLSCVVMAMV